MPSIQALDEQPAELCADEAHVPRERYKHFVIDILDSNEDSRRIEDTIRGFRDAGNLPNSHPLMLVNASRPRVQHPQTLRDFMDWCWKSIEGLILDKQQWDRWFDNSVWYSSTMISNAMISVYEWLRSWNPEAYKQTVVHDVLLYMPGASEMKTFFDSTTCRPPRGIVAPFLGEDASWRGKLVVLPASVGSHWVVHVIWQHTFLTYDGLQGGQDPEEYRSVCHHVRAH